MYCNLFKFYKNEKFKEDSLNNFELIEFLLLIFFSLIFSLCNKFNSIYIFCILEFVYIYIFKFLLIPYWLCLYIYCFNCLWSNYIFFVYFSYKREKDSMSGDISGNFFINFKRFESVSLDDVIPIETAELVVGQQNDLSFLTVRESNKKK